MVLHLKWCMEIKTINFQPSDSQKFEKKSNRSISKIVTQRFVVPVKDQNRPKRTVVSQFRHLLTKWTCGLDPNRQNNVFGLFGPGLLKISTSSPSWIFEPLVPIPTVVADVPVFFPHLGKILGYKAGVSEREYVIWKPRTARIGSLIRTPTRNGSPLANRDPESLIDHEKYDWCITSYFRLHNWTPSWQSEMESVFKSRARFQIIKNPSDDLCRLSYLDHKNEMVSHHKVKLQSSNH